jgi:hypothetical protein
MTKLLIAGLFLGAAGIAAADAPPPEKPHHKPPQEALDACAKAAKADACAFKHDDKNVKGICQERRHGTGLVCRPDHAPPPPPPAK